MRPIVAGVYDSCLSGSRTRPPLTGAAERRLVPFQRPVDGALQGRVELSVFRDDLKAVILEI